MGRCKITITRIDEEKRRKVTLRKRTAGILKKAYELSVLCGADVSLVINSRERGTVAYGTNGNATVQNLAALGKKPDATKYDNISAGEKFMMDVYDESEDLDGPPSPTPSYLSNSSTCSSSSNRTTPRSSTTTTRPSNNIKAAKTKSKKVDTKKLTNTLRYATKTKTSTHTNTPPSSPPPSPPPRSRSHQRQQQQPASIDFTIAAANLKVLEAFKLLEPSLYNSVPNPVSMEFADDDDPERTPSSSHVMALNDIVKNQTTTTTSTTMGTKRMTKRIFQRKDSFTKPTLAELQRTLLSDITGSDSPERLSSFPSRIPSLPSRIPSWSSFGLANGFTSSPTNSPEIYSLLMNTMQESPIFN